MPRCRGDEKSAMTHGRGKGRKRITVIRGHKTKFQECKGAGEPLCFRLLHHPTLPGASPHSLLGPVTIIIVINIFLLLVSANTHPTVL